jgi:hypothetical protein
MASFSSVPPDITAPARLATLRWLIYPMAGGHPGGLSIWWPVVIPRTVPTGSPEPVWANASAINRYSVVEQPLSINHGGGFCARRAGIDPRLLSLAAL